MSLREIRKPVPGLHIKTEEEYFEFEEGALEKHEFYKGEIFAMAGASVAHNRIVRNSLTAIDAFSKAKDCEVFLSDLKVHVEANSLFTYPDLSILCGKPNFYHDRTDTITNPVVLVEVLSPSTMNYDRGGKFSLYREIPSLKEYVLISSTEYRFEKFVRQTDGGWNFSEVRNPADNVRIETIDWSVSLVELYRNVDFELAV